jgi:hypothetical protein
MLVAGGLIAVANAQSSLSGKLTARQGFRYEDGGTGQISGENSGM